MKTLQERPDQIHGAVKVRIPRPDRARAAGEVCPCNAHSINCVYAHNIWTAGVRAGGLRASGRGKAKAAPNAVGKRENSAAKSIIRAGAPYPACEVWEPRPVNGERGAG